MLALNPRPQRIVDQSHTYCWPLKEYESIVSEVLRILCGKAVQNWALTSCSYEFRPQYFLKYHTYDCI